MHKGKTINKLCLYCGFVGESILRFRDVRVLLEAQFSESTEDTW